ncbi:MAG: hypothetical protein ND866_09160, partial [Pyrinomonadaceae bacterium]|nr:hypothetical protein [Pyrinomonadaceae bacterium]
ISEMFIGGRAAMGDSETIHELTRNGTTQMPYFVLFRVISWIVFAFQRRSVYTAGVRFSRCELLLD